MHPSNRNKRATKVTSRVVLLSNRQLTLYRRPQRVYRTFWAGYS
jgi:hypothetical protein